MANQYCSTPLLYFSFPAGHDLVAACGAVRVFEIIQNFQILAFQQPVFLS
jgi:hypothetical protein